MRLKYLTSEFKKNWLISSLGVVLLVIGTTVLSINEGEFFFNFLHVLEGIYFIQGVLSITIEPCKMPY